MKEFTDVLRKVNPWLLLTLGFTIGLTVALMLANYYIDGVLTELMRTF